MNEISWEMIGIMWMVFFVMTGSILIFAAHHQNLVLGVAMAPAHMKEEPVRKVVRKFKISCWSVLGISMLLSSLPFMGPVRNYSEILLIVLCIFNQMANWWFLHYYQKQLQVLKKAKGWTGKGKVVGVDLDVVRERGKSSVSQVWVWIFLVLSFFPVLWDLLEKQPKMTAPLIFLFLGPFCQAVTIPLYYGMRRMHTPALSEDTEINKASARTEERINTRAAVMSSAAMLVFWIFFSLTSMIKQAGIYWLLSIIFLTGSILMIAFWQQRSIRKSEKYFFGEDAGEEDVPEEDILWRWGFYYNPADRRLMVPKRIAGFGWTINMGRPVGKAIALGFMLFLVGILGSVIWIGSSNYTITKSGSRMIFHAAFYETAIEKEKVISVTEVTSLPDGTRTNGYGGVEKSYGHFEFDGYGKCMVYMYNHADKFIILKLDQNNPSYVIFNEKTAQQTDSMYRSTKQWTAK